MRLKELLLWSHILVVWLFVKFGSANRVFQQDIGLDIKTFPEGRFSVREGGHAVMDCRDEGPLRAKVMWYSRNRIPVQQQQNGRLTITNFQSNQSGRYTCKAVGYRGVPNCAKSVYVAVDRRTLGYETSYYPRSPPCGINYTPCRNGNCINWNWEDCVNKTNNIPRPPYLQPLPPRTSSPMACSYSAWSTCNSKCVQMRKTVCRNRESGRRTVAVEERVCNDGACVVAVNGGWSEWSLWSTCSLRCGPGSRRRDRRCDKPPPSYGGADCVGQSYEEEECEEVPCPVHGGWSEWSKWSNCTDDGKKTRKRMCDNPPPMYDGDACTGTELETMDCVICASSVKMDLTPGRVKCKLGKPTTFLCSYCTSDAQKLVIDMDTLPSAKGSSLFDNIHKATFNGTCGQQIWTIKLNTEHTHVTCALNNSEGFVVGTLVSSVHVEYNTPIPTEFCGLNHFLCANRHCVHNSYRCNGDDDCGDMSDEMGCPMNSFFGCRPDQFMCDSVRQCVAQWMVCDGQIDCPDGSDEHHCAIGEQLCGNDEFCCNNKRCVRDDCECNYINDCWDNSDELNCQYDHVIPRDHVTSSHRSHPLMPHHVLPCRDDEFRCTNSTVCISNRRKCDRRNDCSDGSDETEDLCRWWDRDEGRDQVDRFHPSASEVEYIALHSSRTTTSTTDITNDLTTSSFDAETSTDVATTETEDTTTDNADGESYTTDESNESTSKDYTSTRKKKCNSKQYRCADKQQCIDVFHQCDGHYDCGDKSDERDCPASPCRPKHKLCAAGGQCIRSFMFCDGDKDCEDGSDEKDCQDD